MITIARIWSKSLRSGNCGTSSNNQASEFRERIVLFSALIRCNKLSNSQSSQSESYFGNWAGTLTTKVSHRTRVSFPSRSGWDFFRDFPVTAFAPDFFIQTAVRPLVGRLYPIWELLRSFSVSYRFSTTESPSPGGVVGSSAFRGRESRPHIRHRAWT